MACPRCGTVHKPWQCSGVTKPRDKKPSVTKAVTELVTPPVVEFVRRPGFRPATPEEEAEYWAEVSGRSRGRPRKDGPVSASTERKRRQRARQKAGKDG